MMRSRGLARSNSRFRRREHLGLQAREELLAGVGQSSRPRALPGPSALMGHSFLNPEPDGFHESSGSGDSCFGVVGKLEGRGRRLVSRCPRIDPSFLFGPAVGTTSAFTWRAEGPIVWIQRVSRGGSLLVGVEDAEPSELGQVEPRAGGSPRKAYRTPPREHRRIVTRFECVELE